MNFQLHGGSPSSTSSSDIYRHSTNSSLHPQTSLSPDPTLSWWDSISKARSRIHLLIPLLPPNANPLSSLADTECPARSLLLSSAAYSSLSAALSSPSSGSADDPLCNWLYDTYQSGDADLRLVVLSYLPLISAVYLHRIHHRHSDDFVSLSGFEAVLLTIYSSELIARNGKPVTISIPDLSQPSLYHSPRNPMKSPSNPNQPTPRIVSPPLEPQMAVKSPKRPCIVGVALDCYYKQISQMPNWSKLDFCKFATAWAGENSPCTSEFFEADNVAERVKNLGIDDGNSTEIRGNYARIPLPWELLQPILRILGHCLLGPLNVDEVRDAASIAVGNLYARATHDLFPQAILATRSLVQLDRTMRQAVTDDVSNVYKAKAKAKKPEILLIS